MKTFSLSALAILTLLIVIGCQNQTTEVTTPGITIFRFDQENNAGLASDILGVIDPETREITATLSSGSSAEALIAKFYVTGESVSVNGITQVSGETSNNFTNPVIYRLKVNENETIDYTVIITVLSEATAPGAVTTANAVDSTNGDFIITWDAPDLTDAKDNDGDNLTANKVSYKVMYVLESEISSSDLTDAQKVSIIKTQAEGKSIPQVVELVRGEPTDNTLTITTDSGTYSVIVVAYNKTDTTKMTLPDAPINVTVTSEATAPGEITNLIKDNTTGGEFTITWNAPTLIDAKDKDGDYLTANKVSYKVMYLLNSDIVPSLPDGDKVAWIKNQAPNLTTPQVVKIETGKQSNNSVTITADAGSYSFIVVAINKTDNTKITLPNAPDNVIVSEPVIDLATAPGNVTNLSTDNATPGQFTVSWDAPALTDAKDKDGNELTPQLVSYTVMYLLESEISAATNVTTDAEKVSYIGSQSITKNQFVSIEQGQANNNSMTITADAGSYSVIVVAINKTDATKMTLPDAPINVIVSEPVIDLATAPGNVTSLSTDNATPGQFTVSWDAPTLTDAKDKDGNPLTFDLVSYKVMYLLESEISAEPGLTTDADKVNFIEAQAPNKSSPQVSVIDPGKQSNNSVTIKTNADTYSVIVVAINKSDDTKKTLPDAPITVIVNP